MFGGAVSRLSGLLLMHVSCVAFALQGLKASLGGIGQPYRQKLILKAATILSIPFYFVVSLSLGCITCASARHIVVQFHCRDPVGWGAWKIKWFKSRWGDAVENIRLRLALERKHVTANYSLPTLRWAPTSHLPACFSTNHYYEVHFEETRLPASHTKPGIVPANRQPKQHMWVIRSGGVDSRKDLVHKYIGHDQENLAVQKYQGFVIQQAARIYGLQRSLQPAIPR
jgi:hypothetical protein